MMRKILLLFCTICTILSLFSQSKPNLPAVPLSPNAAELAKYADSPVSYYTGTPNIDIPLYEINIDDLKIPINLNYHASGIRVNQEATWVGLGWSLDIGSRVSRTVNGFDDFLLNPEFLTGAKITNGYYDAPDIGSNYDNHYSLDGGTHNLCNIPSLEYNLKYDSEPDIFFYNLLGMNGKFILDKSRGAVLFDKSHNVKIEVIKSTSLGITFKITDDKGNQYFYNQWEITKNYIENNALNKNYTDSNLKYDDNINNYITWNWEGEFTCSDDTIYEQYDYYPSPQTPYPMRTSWCLTKIITKKGNEINFIYDSETQYLPTQESCENYRYGLNSLTNSALYYSRSKIVNNALRLTKIEWNQGKIEFNASSRIDIKGNSQKLDSLAIYDKSNKMIKSYGFNYTYFNNDYSENTQYEYVFKRLKLNQIIEHSSINQPINKGYTFDYYEGDFPAKNSKNVDYWGFQNGKNYGANYYIGIQINNNKFEGVRKDANFDKAIIGTLKTITYPTGGTQEFKFESNKIYSGFFNNNTYSPDDYLIEDIEVYNENSNISHPVNNSLPSHKTYSFTLQKDTEVKINCSLEDQGGSLDPNYLYNSSSNNPLGRLRKVNPTTQIIYSFDCPETIDGVQNWPPYNWSGEGSERTLKEKIFILPAGTYEFEAYTPPKNLITNWRLSYENDLVYPSAELDGGGIRIKEIKTDAKTRKFAYPIGTILVQPLLYYLGRTVGLPSYISKTIAQVSESQTPLSTFKYGYTIGYDWVHEYMINQNNHISKTSYSFYNDTENEYFDDNFPDSPRYINYRNSLLKSIEKYKDSSLVEKNEISYTSTFSNYINAFKDKSLHRLNDFMLSYNYHIEWPLKSKEINTLYTDYGNQISSEVKYIYNTKDLPIEVNNTSATGEVIQTKYQYAHEKSNQYLIDKNMIGIPLQTTVTKNNIGISSIETKYPISQTDANTKTSGLALPYEVESKTLYGSSTQKELTYDQYNNKGNIVQYTEKGLKPTVIIWGYNKTQPIAKIEGAKYDDIKTIQVVLDAITASDTDATQGTASSEQSLLTALDNLRINSSLSNYTITTYTYDPLIGVTSITPPSGIREIYKYDTANRLQSVVDINGKILKEYQYNYKQ